MRRRSKLLLELVGVADLDPDRARASLMRTGWPEQQAAAGLVTAHARGTVVANATVEADVFVGPVLAAHARAASVVHSFVYGNQPALVCELINWARVSGLEVVCAGKGTKYLPGSHASTPDTVWDHWGLDHNHARELGLNAQMFNSFLDGTKPAIEMATVAAVAKRDLKAR